MAEIYYLRGDSSDALRQLQHSLRIIRDLKDIRHEGAVLRFMGGVFESMGDTIRAAQSYRQAISLLRSMQDRREEAYGLGNLARLVMPASPEEGGP